jgi:hypothetical protein
MPKGHPVTIRGYLAAFCNPRGRRLWRPRPARIVNAEFYEPHYFEVFDGLPRQKNGYVELPRGPGLGLTLNEDVIAAHPYLPMRRGERGI